MMYLISCRLSSNSNVSKVINSIRVIGHKVTLEILLYNYILLRELISMNTLKSLVDSVISDLTENKSIESILLKTQAISHYLKDEEFSTWIKHEMNGYGDDDYPLPSYRKINCIVKVDISQPFGRMVKNYQFPCECINDEKIRESMTHMPVYESLSEIELMMKDGKQGNDLTMAVSLYIVQNYMSKWVEGNILVANKHINMNNIQAVISKFKSLLLTFFLELNDKMNWELNFDVMATKQIIKQIMVTNNINAAVVATEGSSISAGSVSVENSHIGNVAYSNEQKEFLSVLKDIEKLIKESGNQDLKDFVDIVKAETQKPKWNKKLVTMGLNAIKGIANGFVVKGLMTLVEKAIVVLGAC